jgi:polar amino acid transport system substrate-binding protein
VPAIVIDKLVLRYMTLNSPVRDNIMFSEKAFVEQTLHVCFQRTPEGKAMQEAFDAGLKKVDVPKFESAYFKRLEAKVK